MKIQKLKDKYFQGFICDKCERQLKHAFSINGSGIFGSECVIEVAGLNSKKQVQEQMTLQKIWNKMIANPKIYSLDVYIAEYGNIDIVEKRFFANGELS